MIQHDFTPYAYINNYEVSQHPRLLVEKSKNDDETLKARQLMADEYVRRKFITADQLDDHGVLGLEQDPYHENATYFLLSNDQDECVATLRTLEYSPRMGRESFPVLKYENALYPEYKKAIEEIGVENLIEVSALVRDKDQDTQGTAAIRLYKELFQSAWSGSDSRDKTLIMACNPKLYGMFKVLFDGSIERIGPDLPYPGQEAVPAMFKLHEGALNLINISKDRNNPYRKVHKKVVEYFLDGSDAKDFHPDILEALDQNGYDEIASFMRRGEWPASKKTEDQVQSELKKAAIGGGIKEKVKTYRPEIYSSLGLIAYSLARAAAVKEGIDPVSDVSWETFLGIEVATTPQYVWGIGDLVRNADNDDYSKKRKVGAYAAAASAFAAPYGYLLSYGALDSSQGAGATAGVVGISMVPTAVKKLKKRFSRTKKSISED